MLRNQTQRTPGRPRASEKRVPTSTRILQTAAQLFIENGFENVSLELVAEKCGVTKATVYYYFDGKAALFTASVIQLMNTIRERTLEIMQQQKSLRERLYTVAVQRLSVNNTYMNFEALMREADNMLAPEQERAMRVAEERLAQVLVEAFDDAVRRKELCPVNPLLAAHAYLALLSVGTARNAEGGLHFPNPQETALSLMDMFWNGISHQAGSSDEAKTPLRAREM